MSASTDGRTLGRHAGLNFLTQLVSAVGQVMSAAIVARVLGPELTGTYGFLIFVIAMGATTATLGLPSMIIRYTSVLTARGEPELAVELTARALRWAVAWTSLVAIGIAGAAQAGAFRVPVTGLQAVLVASTVAISAAVTLATAVLTGRERFDTLLKASALMAPFAVIATVTAVLLAARLTSVLTAGLVVAAVNAVVLVGPLGASFRRTRTPLPKELRQHTRSYLLMLSAIAVLDTIVWQRVEVLFLAHYSARAEIAYYTLPFTLVSRMMTLLPGALSGVLLPRFASEQDDKAKGSATYARALWIAAIVTAPLVAGGIAFAGPIVEVLFGQDYAPAAAVMRVLLIGAGCGALGAVGAAGFYATGNQGVVLRFAFVLAVLNIGLDLLLIPTHGALGAAVANSGTQVIATVIGFWLITRRTHLAGPWWRISLTIVVAAGSAALAILWSRTGLPPLAVLALEGGTMAVAYPALLAVTYRAGGIRLRSEGMP